MKKVVIIALAMLAAATLVAIASCTQSTTPTCIVSQVDSAVYTRLSSKHTA